MDDSRLTPEEIRRVAMIDALECPACHSSLSPMFTERARPYDFTTHEQLQDWIEEHQGALRLKLGGHLPCPNCGRLLELDAPAPAPVPMTSIQDAESGLEWLLKAWADADMTLPSNRRAAVLSREAIEASRGR